MPKKPTPQSPSPQEEEPEVNEEMLTDFDFKDPSEEDFHGVKNLILSTYRNIWNVDGSSLADTVCEQGNIGSIITTDPEDPSAVIGFVSLLNFSQYPSSQQASKDILQVVETKKKSPQDESFLQALQQALKKKSTGLLLKGYVVNLPDALFAPLLDTLLGDVEWSKSAESGCEEEEKKFYEFETVVFATRIMLYQNQKRIRNATNAAPAKKKKMEKRGEERRGEEGEEREEREEIPMETAEFRYEYSDPTGAASVQERILKSCDLALNGEKLSQEQLEERANELFVAELLNADDAALLKNSSALFAFPTGRTVETPQKKMAPQEFAVLSLLPFKAIKKSLKLIENLM